MDDSFLQLPHLADCKTLDVGGGHIIKNIFTGISHIMIGEITLNIIDVTPMCNVHTCICMHCSVCTHVQSSMHVSVYISN